MQSAWRARAEVTPPIIFWFGIIITALILTTFLYQKIYPLPQESRLVNAALREIRDEANTACNSLYYKTVINPPLERGMLSVTNNEICINTSRIQKCRTMHCDTGIQAEFDLNTITGITLEKDQGFVMSQNNDPIE